MSKFIIEKVTCIDDYHKPNDIKSSNWIKKGEKYTPVRVIFNTLFNNYSFELEEVSVCNPAYSGYNINRFSISEEDIKQLVEEKVLELEEV